MQDLRHAFSSALLIAGVALISVAPRANAQVTLSLTTTEQTNCVAVTDAQGLRLAPSGTDLQATGVTLTGDGCGSANSEFDATVSAPATVVAGTPFNITWSASSDATRCTYGGTPGVSAWPVGQVACSGTACAGPHTQPVTVATAQQYTFSVTCTNATGYAEDGLTASAPAQAPQPPNFALNAPTTATLGTPISVSWSVTGAASCTGSASLGGNSVNVPGWTDSTSATSPRSVTFSQAGTYSMFLTCSNTSDSTQSQTISVVAQASNTDNCPAGRQTIGDICYSYGLGSSCANASDVTKFENIWGRTGPSTPITPFPGAQFFAVIKNLQKTGYIAAKFTVPEDLPLNQWGLFTHGETITGPNLTMKVSSQCGDFSTPIVEPLCLRTDMPPGQPMVKWRVPTAAGVVGCTVVPGQTYFVNLKVTDPATTHDDCSGATCKATVQHNHNP